MQKHLQQTFSLFVILLTFVTVTTEAEDFSKVIKVGVIASLSGEYSQIGQDAVDAITLAQEEFSRANPSFKVKFIVEDDGFSIPKALTAYKKLTNFDNIDAFISVSSTAISAAGSDVTARNLPTAQVFLETESKKDPIVQICPEMSTPEEGLGKYVREHTKGKVIMVVPTNETWLALAKSFEAGFGAELIVEQVPVAEYDLRAIALRIKAANPERVVLLMGAEQGTILIKELNAVIGSKLKFAFDANFLSGIGKYQQELNSIEQFYLAPVLTLPNTENPKFRARFKQRFNRAAGPWAELSYDASQVLLKSYRQDRLEWIKAMHEFDAEGVSGRLSFNDIGVRQTKYEIQTVKEVLN